MYFDRDTKLQPKNSEDKYGQLGSCARRNSEHRGNSEEIVGTFYIERWQRGQGGMYVFPPRGQTGGGKMNTGGAVY